ncbi:hypothetical protein [Blastococcus sp. SYSU DS1024]
MTESVYGGSQQGWIRPDRVPLYRLAYEESQRALDDQASELDGMRQRATQFLAFVGSATAFLVAAGLNAPERDGTFYTLAGLATVVSVATVILAVAILLLVRPSIRHLGRFEWSFRLSASRLIGWIEPEVGGPDEPDFLRAVALRQDAMRERNEANLVKIRYYYAGVIAFGLLQVVLWGALVWATA